MEFIIPPKLKKGNHIRVVAPARSCSLLSEENIALAQRRLESFGFAVSYGKHIFEKDIFWSSSKESRLYDLHEAFSDTSIDAILTVIGGYNSNDLLDDINYDLIQDNPKIFCGFSDITVISTAITKKTGLVTYSGPHFSSWAMKEGFDYSEKCFLEMTSTFGSSKLLSSEQRSDDMRYMDQENREMIKNEGFIAVRDGYATGRIWGGNLCTLNLLQGTTYMPDLNNTILFLEDTDMPGDHFPMEFKRNIRSLLSQIDGTIKGLLIGRFPKKANMSKEKFEFLIKDISELENIPIVTNLDFGHTTPICTIPIGGQVEMIVGQDIKITITG